MFSRVCFFVGTFLFAIPAASTGVRAEYLLQRGDKVELSVAGFPDLRQDSTIGEDGEVTLPIIGEVTADGISISQLQSQVQKVIASRPLHRRGVDGREILTLLTPEQVLVSIVEYSPIYLKGDVAKPGEVKFRPGMTVRQAAAIAGGYDIVRYRMNNPYLEIPDLRAEYETLWTQFASAYTQGQRIEAELKGQAVLDSKQLDNSPLSAETLRKIVSLANEELKARSAAIQGERSFYGDAIKKEDERVTLFKSESEQQGKGAQAELEQMERLRGLQNKGLLSNANMLEISRTALAAKTLELQAKAQVVQAQRSRDEMKLKLAQLDSQHRIQLMHELQQANMTLDAVRKKLQAVGEKFTYVGMIKSQLTSGHASPPKILIVRQGNSGPQEISAGEDTKLAPGDVLEISLKSPGPTVAGF